MTVPNSVLVTQSAMNQIAYRMLNAGGEVYYCLNGGLGELSNVTAVQASEISILGYTRPGFNLGPSIYDLADIRWEASLSLTPTNFIPQESGSFDQTAIVLADDTVYAIATWDNAQPITVGVEFNFFDVLKMTYGNQGSIVNLVDS